MERKENLALRSCALNTLSPSRSGHKAGNELGDMEQQGLPIASFSAIGRLGNSWNRATTSYPNGFK